MAYNGSGTFNLSDTLTASTTATASEVNAILSDIASGLTAALAKDGQSSMTGQFKAASGTVSAPGIAFSSDTNSGFYLISGDTWGLSLGGALIATFDTGGINLASGKTFEINSVDQNAFPSGTRMLFQQTAAPTGWTKDATHNDKALRITSGTVSTGGTVAFETAFASKSVAGTIGGTALTEAQLPAHTHTVDTKSTTYTGGASTFEAINGSAGTPTTETTSSVGSGDTHTHTFTGTAIDLDVQFVDVIIAEKD